ncbi:hypothetical protein LJB76_02825, partial [Clostridia bacterium OttesenSCG-928-O13]|nr:hypothetical protein [Clostridia bacterium OttesenSCG-928-O13]
GDHVYARGDIFPREGSEPDEERIAYLMSEDTNFGKLGLGPVIEQVDDEPVADEEPAGTDDHDGDGVPEGDGGEDAAKEPEAPAEEAKAEKPKAAKGKK